MLELSVLEISKGFESPLNLHLFECLPRIGEWISLEGQFFEVVMVIHHAGNQAGTDLYVKHLGNDVDLLDHLVRGTLP